MSRRSNIAALLFRLPADLRVRRLWLAHGIIWLLCLSCKPLLGATPEPRSLSTVEAVHDLPSEIAAKHLPVHLLAVVTYYEPAAPDLFISDPNGAGGVYVETTHPYSLQRGDLIELTGATSDSFRTEIAADPSIRVLGHVPRKQPTELTGNAYRQIMSAKLDSRESTVRGIVRTADVVNRRKATFLELELMVPGGLMQAYVKNFSPLNPKDLIDAEVLISGTIAVKQNSKLQVMRGIIYATDATDLRITKARRSGLASLPLIPIDDVMQTHTTDDHTPRVRVRGAVTSYHPGASVVINQNGRSLFAETRETTPLTLGSVIDVAGFAQEGGYSPALSQAEILPTGEHREVYPTAVNYTQAISGEFSDELVTLQGRLLAQVQADSGDILSLLVDQHVVTVELQRPDVEEPLPRLPLGTLVTATGICRIIPTAAWDDQGTRPRLFRIDMRSSADLTVLRWPSWWTVSHLLMVLVGLFPVSLLVALWAIALRRRVSQQNKCIARTVLFEKERSRLLEAISSEAPLEGLLRDVREFVGAFAPGLRCCCSLYSTSSEADIEYHAFTIGELPASVLLQKTLVSGSGAVIGLFSVGSEDQSIRLTGEQGEVASSGAALAALAVNQRRLYHELNYTSSHDALTGLPNRRTADIHLDTALEAAAKSDHRAGVAYIDVDRFKQVNDQHGHKVGDQYLQQIAARLSCDIRGTDCLARIGGDEFLLVASTLSTVEELETLRHRLRACFDDVFVIDGIRISGSASVGIAAYPDHGAVAEDLKRHADIDMYSAKQRSHAQAQEDAAVEGATEIFTRSDLEMALKAGHFRLVYQPQFSPSGQMCGLEALLRLEDPILGTIAPDAFIGLAERSSLIHPLGLWVLRQALADAKRWRFDDIPGVRMIINVSPAQIEQEGFADEVFAALALQELPASCLEIEITERTVVRDLDQAGRQLNRLHAAGVRIAIDDFGVEHSCLSSLYLLPLDTLKIDRSFIKAMGTEPGILPIIKAIVDMAQSMHKRVVAEGIETQADIDALLNLGEMDLQGYFLSRPQGPEEISRKMVAWTSGIDVLR